MKLAEIYIYPIKSLPGISVSRAQIQSQGLQDDRLMMLVDENGRFITQRKYPQLATISVSKASMGYSLRTSELGEILIDTDSFTKETCQVIVWSDTCEAFTAKPSINAWFSSFLKQPVKLVKYNFNKTRATDPVYSKPGDHVSFADGFPILLLSTDSIDDLNSRLQTPVTIKHFRPNIVVNGCGAYAEDDWPRIIIGPTTFDMVKPCSRCIMTTVDPLSGKKSVDRQPLKTLSDYRNSPLGALLGVNLIPRRLGVIEINDDLSVINQQ